MNAPGLMAAAALLFAAMGAAVKVASDHYSAGEIVFYRSLIGVALLWPWMRSKGISWRTRYPAAHFWRSVTGSSALCLWFIAIGGLPLATAMTLNYMSSVWIALFLLGGTVLMVPAKAAGAGLDGRLVAAVLAGFVGVALVLRPTLAQDQLWYGLIGLGSGLIAAMAYLQVTALGRLGEPGERVVLYFSLSGVVFGAVIAVAQGGLHAHTWRSLGLLVSIGVLATAAQWMITRAYGTGVTLGIAALQYLGIVFSSVLGLVLFDETLTWLALAGMVLIIAAGVAATLLQPRPNASISSPTDP